MVLLTVRGLRRGAIVTVAIVGLLLISGCASQAPAAEQDVGLSSGWFAGIEWQVSGAHARFSAWQNQTLALWFESPQPWNLTLELTRLQGPMYSGIAMVPLHDGPDGLELQGVRYYYDRWEFAKLKRMNAPSGPDETICWGPQMEPCQLRARGWVNQTRFYPPIVMSAGTSVAVIETSFAHADLPDAISEFGIGWTSGAQLRGVYQINSTSLRFATESFDGSLVDIDRCRFIAWCGRVEDGVLPLDFKKEAYHFLYYIATGGNGAQMDVCLADTDNADSAPDCGVVHSPPTSKYKVMSLGRFLGANTSYDALTMEAWAPIRQPEYLKTTINVSGSMLSFSETPWRTGPERPGL